MNPERDDARTRTPANWLDELLTPQPVRLSLSLKRLLISQFSPDALRTLAYMKEQESPGSKARLRLSQASVEELAEMLTAGRKPTIGFWRRQPDVAA